MTHNEINTLINLWSRIKSQLADLSIIERELRKEIADKILGDKIEGSATTTLGNYKLSATAVLNYTVDREALELIEDELSSLELNAIDWKPLARPAAFRKLPPESKLHRVVSVKPGMSQLKIVEVLDEDNDNEANS